MKTYFSKIIKKESIFYWMRVSVIGVVLGVSFQFVLAWREPAVAPPGDNLSAPINIGVTSQTKSGGIGAYSFTGNFMHLSTISGISSPIAGDVYSNGSNIYYYNGSTWDDLTETGSSLWTASGSNIYNSNTGNVGIGTTSPSDKLHIRPISYTSNQNGGIRLSDTGGNWDFRLALKSNASGAPRWGFDTDSVADAMSIVNAGNVGIGTDAPSDKLHIRPISYTSNQNGGIRLSDTGGNWNFRLALKSDSLGVPRWSFDTDNVTDAMAIVNNGNVGIGTNAPSTKLHVAGGARVTGLASCNTIDTDANGNLSCGTDADGSAYSGINTGDCSNVYVQNDGWVNCPNNYAVVGVFVQGTGCGGECVSTTIKCCRVR